MERSPRQTVFILGAGASVHARGPTMDTFIDRAEDLHRSLGESDDKFKLFFDGLFELRGVHRNASIDTGNIESVFGAFEMAELLAVRPRRLWRQLVGVTKYVILSTLDAAIEYRLDGDSARILPPIGYEHFATFLFNVCEKERVSILTFNYDCALDYAIGRSPLHGVDYCLEPESRADNWIPLLKLHGSLNWGVGEDGRIQAGTILKDYSVPGQPTAIVRGRDWFGAKSASQNLMLVPTWDR